MTPRPIGLVEGDLLARARTPEGREEIKAKMATYRELLAQSRENLADLQDLIDVNERRLMMCANAMAATSAVRAV